MAEDDALHFVDDLPESAVTSLGGWRVLIVDDERDIHEATEFALRGLVIEGRPLQFMRAYSAREAHAILTRDQDVAVILLDVVMESEDAGLRLIQRIREELDNQAIRIILRTGQAGYAPEIETIRAHDINDYKTKSELTRVRLFTSLTVAIRSYRQIRQLEMSRRGLELIVSASTGLSKLRALGHFAEGVVTQLCALLDIVPDGVVCVLSPDHEIPRVIAAAGRYHAFIQYPLHELPDAAVRAKLETCLTTRGHLFDNGTCLYFHVNGTRGIAAYVDVARELDSIDQDLLKVFCANMTVGFENVLLHQRLVESAYYDPLLHLPNRNRLIQLIDEAKTGDTNMLLALVDLDDFAEINTVLDHHFGDKVLRAVASRLTRLFAPPVILARVAGDAFGLVGPSDKIHRASIEEAFSVPFNLEGEVIRISATASLIPLNLDSADGGELLKDASIALKQAKLLSRGRAAYFSADLSLAARERIRMLTSLRAAFSADRLFLAFQPFIQLASGRVTGAEALLRWRTEDGRFIPPHEFIPLAEQSGLMVPIGEWVLRGALHQLKQLTSLGHVGFRMAINVSQTQFREPDFVAMVGRALDEYQVSPERVELELTESVAIGHADATVAKIAEIRRMGLSIALDDFGTGYSSLSVLKQLNVDRLKIDRAFTREIGQPGHQGGIAGIIVALGRQLDLNIIAEGVETLEQRHYLRELGCQEGQGYLFSQPLPSERFGKWLRDYHEPGLSLLENHPDI